MRCFDEAVRSWLFIEVGGSSGQTAQLDSSGNFQFSSGIIREPGRPIALACPGLIRDRRVLYATNLGWPDDADPAHELGVARIDILENDVRAAALGESVLRSSNTPGLDLLYINLGTGVGDAQVVDGLATHFDLAHHLVGGTLYCTGCRAIGCVNAHLCSENLPAVLTKEDCAFVARTLALALEDMSVEPSLPVVLGGGMARRYPAIARILDKLVANPTEITAAPANAKSAAYAGLEYLVRLRNMV